MPVVHANVMVKNEGLILREVLPIWKNYPIDSFVFLNDGSEDDTAEVINEILGSRAVILERPLEKFHEAKNRAKMLEYSRNKSDFVISIDADELLTTNMIQHWDQIMKTCQDFDLKMYWFNNVFDISTIRQDPAYVSNFRTFILNTKTCGEFDLSGERYHTPRTPNNNLQVVGTKDIGVLHLQALNVKHYVLKQLWYKHYEFVNYGYSASEINQRYDPVVNHLNFCEVSIPSQLVQGIKIDSSVFDKISEKKRYKEYIISNLNNDLLTFGKEFLD